MMYYFFFFFSSRRRHTRFKCDWSSDVCSSDLDLRHYLRRALEVLLQNDNRVIRGVVHAGYDAAAREIRIVVRDACRLERSEERRVGKEGGWGVMWARWSVDRRGEMM